MTYRCEPCGSYSVRTVTGHHEQRCDACQCLLIEHAKDAMLEREFRRKQIEERSAGGRKPLECRCELPTKKATPALMAYLGATDATDPKVVEHLAIVNEFGGAMHSHTNDLLFCRWDPATKTMVWDLP